MRKFLLLIAVALFTTAGFAQTEQYLWGSSIAAFDAQTKPEYNSPAAIDKDGNIYVTGTQTLTLQFAGKSAEVLATGAYIAKYDATGKELFAITLHGSITITAITTDAENNFYVAGKFADQAYITDVEGQEGEYETITNSEPDNQSATFIAKYDSNGNLLNVKSFEAVHNLPEGAEFWGSSAYITIGKLLAEGSKVYAQFTCNASATLSDMISFIPNYSVEDYSAFGMGIAYFDMVAHSLIAFDSNLNAIENVATFAAAEGAAAATNMTMNFTVEGDDIYVASYALGNITLTTSAGIEKFDFAINEDYTTEKGIVVAKVGAKFAKFVGNADDEYYSFYRIADMNVMGGKLYLAGTFQSSLALDNKVTSVGKTDLFVASFDAAELTLDWTYTNAYDEGEKNNYYEQAFAVFANDKIQVISVKRDMNETAPVSAKNYEVSLAGEGNAYDGAVANVVAYNDGLVCLINCTDKTYINVYKAEGFAADVEEVVTEVEENVIYDLTGRRIEEITEAGIYIVNGSKVLVK